MGIVQYVGKELIKNIIYVFIDPYFYLTSFLILYMYKRTLEDTLDKKQIRNSAILDILRGMSIGIIFSTLFLAKNKWIVLEGKMFILIPIALLLFWISPKWCCFSYVIPVAYGLYCLSKFFGKTSEWLYLSYPSFIELIGLLHIIEGILVFSFGKENAIQDIIYEEGKLKRIYILQKYWPVPLFIFILMGKFKWLAPLYGMLGYRDVCSIRTPKEKSRFSGSILMLYGVGMMFLGWLVTKGSIPVLLAMCIMPLSHESTFILGKLYDQETYKKVN